MKTAVNIHLACCAILISLVLTPAPECFGWERFKTATPSLSDTSRKPAAIMISPFGLVAGRYSKLKLRIQGTAKKHFAIGTDLKLFFNSYSGFQVNPFIKYFMASDNSEGFYFYASGLYGMNKNLPPQKTKKYSCYGAGAGIGIQVLLGKQKNGMFDIGMGVKYVATEADLDINNVPNSYDDFFTIGPAAIFDTNFSIGFRF